MVLRGGMVRLVGAATELGEGALAEGVEASGAGATLLEDGEGGGVAGDGFFLQGFHRFEEGSLEMGFDFFCGAGGDLDGGAEVEQGFGQALVPKRILDGQGEEGAAAGDAGGEGGEARLEVEGALAVVGEAALGSDPEDAAFSEDGEGCAEKLGGTTRGVHLDGEDADSLENGVAVQGGGIHGGEMLPGWHELPGKHDRNHGVPPGTVIGVDDEWTLDVGEGVRDANGAEVPAEVATCDAAKEA